MPAQPATWSRRPTPASAEAYNPASSLPHPSTHEGVRELCLVPLSKLRQYWLLEASEAT